MYIGRSQQEEEKYLQTTIKAINELIEEFGGLSTEQDKEIRKQRKFLWDNRNEFDEFEVFDELEDIPLDEELPLSLVAFLGLSVVILSAG